MINYKKLNSYLANYYNTKKFFLNLMKFVCTTLLNNFHFFSKKNFLYKQVKFFNILKTFFLLKHISIKSLNKK